LDKLLGLVEAGAFRQTDREMVDRLVRWAERSEVQELFNSPAKLIHADLGSDNIFLTEDGYRVIDWQYPRRAPEEVDWACYLEGVNVDPLKYASPVAVGVFLFIRLNWLVECKRRLFPQGESYDRQVAGLASEILAH
jgi:thiamine kinase-like enzyme